MTGRTWPVKETSPKTTLPFWGALFFRAEIRARQMAKSAAGSFIFRPPEMLMKTSWSANL